MEKCLQKERKGKVIISAMRGYHWTSYRYLKKKTV